MAEATSLSPNTFCFSTATIRTRLKVTFIFSLPMLLSAAYFTNTLNFTVTSSRIQWSRHHVCNHYIHKQRIIQNYGFVFQVPPHKISHPCQQCFIAYRH